MKHLITAAVSVWCHCSGLLQVLYLYMQFPARHLFLGVPQFSHSVVSDSLQPHGLKHARPPCPSPTPGVDSNSSIESVMLPNHLILCRPFSSCPQSFPASRSFPMSQLFASGGRSIGVSASASVLPMDMQDWFLLGWTGWISLLLSPGPGAQGSVCALQESVSQSCVSSGHSVVG